MVRDKKKEITLKGIPASPGIAIGKALLLDREQYVIPRRSIKEEQVQAEVKRFKDALIQTKKHLAWYAAGLGHATDCRAAIFRARTIDEACNVFEQHWELSARDAAAPGAEPCLSPTELCPSPAGETA